MKRNDIPSHNIKRRLFSCSLIISIYALFPLIVSAQVNPLSQQVTIPHLRTSVEKSNLGQSNSTLFRINTASDSVLSTIDDKSESSEPQKLNPLAQPNDFEVGVHRPTFRKPMTLRENRPSLSNLVPPAVPVGAYYTESEQPFDFSEPLTPGNTSSPGYRSELPGALSVPSAEPFVPAQQLDSSDLAKIDEIIAKGGILEKEERWSEALALYENAIRTFRKPPVLMQRFRFARFHHDLARRYSDSSFDMLLREMTYADALALYDEVVSKIQTSHVDPPHWNELFENGVRDFEIALANSAFRRRHIPNVDAVRVRSLSQKIVQASSNWEIRDTKTLRNSIIAIAETCRKEIGLESNAVILEFLAGMTNSLDPYTEFMTLNQFNDTSCMISGRFVGLGVELKSDRKSLYINRVISDSPAEKNGLKNLDRILYVDGTATEGLPLETASNLLQGQAGSTVHLVIQSGATPPREVAICREHLKVPSVENVHILNEYDQGKNVGYFKLTGFQRNTVQEIVDALHYLYQQGMQSLIIDLRGNAGGVLTESIGAADLFLRQGIIVRTKNRGPVPEYRYSATQKSFAWDIPLIVLIDKDSASASEIFAGAIQDNNRGLIIGQPSFGKDTVQAVIPLTGGNPQNTNPIAGLKLTTETYYSPNGKSFSGIGVQPDVVASNVVSHTVAYPSAEPHGGPSSQSPAPIDQVLKTAIDEIGRAFRKNQQALSSQYQPSIN